VSWKSSDPRFKIIQARFAEVVILATQKICLLTAYVEGLFFEHYMKVGTQAGNLFDIRGEQVPFWKPYISGR
jgi:hypothetical protein